MISCIYGKTLTKLLVLNVFTSYCPSNHLYIILQKCSNKPYSLMIYRWSLDKYLNCVDNLRTGKQFVNGIPGEQPINNTKYDIANHSFNDWFELVD